MTPPRWAPDASRARRAGWLWLLVPLAVGLVGGSVLAWLGGAAAPGYTVF